jgi:NAD(P)-dependent dehydrogenase (short-subunit alcohol dehydrogenase family)
MDWESNAWSVVMGISYDFGGQTAIVTGGARGIGRAISQVLCSSGADVWIWDIDPVDLPGTHSIPVDVTKRADIAKTLGLMPRKPIDILINDAGYLGPIPGVRGIRS